MVRRFLSIVLCLFLFTPFLGAFALKNQAVASKDSTPRAMINLKVGSSDAEKALSALVPKLERSMKVRFARFKVDKLPVSLKYLADRAPAQIGAKISSLGERDLQDEEVGALQTWVIESLRSSAGKTLADRVESRDRKSINGDPDKEITDLEKSIERDREIVRAAMGLQAADVELAQRAGFSGLSDAPVTDYVYPSQPSGEPARGLETMFRSAGVWFMVSGELESVGSFIRLRLMVDHALLERRLLDKTFDLAVDDVRDIGNRVADSLVQALFGYLPARLEVIPDISAASVILDPPASGGTAGIWPYLEAGKYKITVEANGYQTWFKEILVENGRIITLKPIMKALETKKVIIDSMIPAMVWDGAEYLGTTPCEVAILARERLVAVKAEGYQTQVYRLDAKVSGRIMFILHPVGVSWDDEVKARRDRVYESLGIFAVSLVLPILMDGLLKNEQKVYLDKDVAGDFLSGVADRATTYYYLKNVGIALSAALLVNSLYNVGTYIDAANHMDYGDPVIIPEE